MPNIYINVAEGRTGSRRGAELCVQQPAGPAAECPLPVAESRGAPPAVFDSRRGSFPGPPAAPSPRGGDPPPPAPAPSPAAREQDAGGALLARSGRTGPAGPGAAGHPVPAPVGAALEPQPGPHQRSAPAQGLHGLALLRGDPALAAPGKAQGNGEWVGRDWLWPWIDLQLVLRAPASTVPVGRGTEMFSRPTSWAVQWCV